MGSHIEYVKKNKWILFMFFIIILLLVSQKERKQAKPDYVDIMLDNRGGDIPNTNEGTLLTFTKMDMSKIFINPSQRLRYVVLFSSKAMDGFVLRYNFIDSTLEAGLPLIKAETINLLDGNMHQIGYTFKKGVGQELYLDGIKLASGMFTGEKEKSATGFAVRESAVLIPVGQEINARYVGRQLNEHELREIFNKQG